MDNNYVNNLHARIDNILSDVYFGAPDIQRPLKTMPINNNDNGVTSTVIIWIILGLVLGVIICYFSMFYLEDENDDNKKK